MTKKMGRVAPAIAAIVFAVALIVLSVLSGVPTASAQVLKGNTFANVAAVQHRLTTLGYYKGAVDGVWGSNTKSAVRRFQADRGITADGVIGSKTESALSLTLPISGGITYGKTTANVAAVQARLRTYGYYTSVVDGSWGNKTLSAVLKYQSNNGMKCDGKVGSSTCSKLGLKLSSSPRSGGINKGKSTANVKSVQNVLRNAGYYKGTVDGVWGNKTMCAVMAFQSDHGLTVDGVVGASTERALGISLTSGSTGSVGSTGSTGSISNSDLNLLARCVYGEARGEPYSGQVAVAAVVLNRVKSSKFPNSISGVIYQSGAFTAVSDGQINLTPNDTAYSAARDALGGWDPTGGCLYYYNPATATSSWIWSLSVHIRIGKHNFAL